MDVHMPRALPPFVPGDVAASARARITSLDAARDGRETGQ